MTAIYDFLSGPMVYITFILFIGGSLYRIFNLISEVNEKESFIFSIMSLKFGLRSVMMWFLPFGTTNMRSKPILTAVSFIFHICLILMPIFLLSHIVLVDESWSLGWFSIPDVVADTMTVLVILSCVFFLVRRLTQPEVKYVTSASDFVILGVVAAPFITGFIAYHQLFSYQLMMILHMLFGEIMLIAIPFTRLSHMLYSPFTRAYMGSEFGGIRHAKDW